MKKEKTFIFNFQSIPIVEEASGNYNQGQKSFKTKTFEDAMKKAQEYFKANEQFRFEWQFYQVIYD